jgi:hypothetical protein
LSSVIGEACLYSGGTLYRKAVRPVVGGPVGAGGFAVGSPQPIYYRSQVALQQSRVAGCRTGYPGGAVTPQERQ